MKGEKAMKKKILFLCTGNSCRSQIAEGLMKDMYGDHFEVASAGINPSSVHPLAVEVMRRVGIDISGQSSKSVRDFLAKDFDYVITVCDNAKQACHNFTGRAKCISWIIPDPCAIEGDDRERMAVFSSVRDRIQEKINHFVKHGVKTDK